MTQAPTPQDTPTLLADLEDAAQSCEVVADACSHRTGAAGEHALAARLRAAGERLTREIELAAPSSEQWNSHVTAVLKRINGGPLPPAGDASDTGGKSEPTRGEPARNDKKGPS